MGRLKTQTGGFKKEDSTWDEGFSYSETIEGLVTTHTHTHAHTCSFVGYKTGSVHKMMFLSLVLHNKYQNMFI